MWKSGNQETSRSVDRESDDLYATAPTWRIEAGQVKPLMHTNGH